MGGRRGGGGSPPPPPTLVAPRRVPLAETFGQFTGQEAQLPGLESFATRINEGFRAEMERGLPGTLAASRQSANLVNQLLSGVPSADQQGFAQRQLAERNMAAGLTPTSEAARFGEAASYGRLSSDLQAQGMGLLPGLLSVSEFMSPQQGQNYLFTSGQIRDEDLQAAQNAANVANQNAINNYNYQVAEQQRKNAESQRNSGFLGSIGGILGGIGGAAVGSVVPGLGTALGASMGSMLGGSVGSYASGGTFAPTAVGGGFGQLAGAMGSSIFGGGGGGGGGGLASYSGGYGSQLGSMNFQAYAAPFTMADMQIRPTSPGLFFGNNPMSYNLSKP